MISHSISWVINVRFSCVCTHRNYCWNDCWLNSLPRETSIKNRYLTLTHWPLGNLNEIFRHVIFKQDFSDWWLRHLLWNCLNMNVTGLHWWSVNFGSGNGLVPSGNKPLPEPMFDPDLCHHMAWLGHNELRGYCHRSRHNCIAVLET